MAARISAKAERLIEIRFALREIKRALDLGQYTAEAPFIGHTEADRVEAFLRTLSWKKGSRGALLSLLVSDIIDAVGEEDFHPAPLLEVARVLEERVLEDIDFSLPKDPKPKK